MASKRAVLYARVSGDDHRKEGRNLAGQLDACRTYAHGKGWRVVAELAEDDRGASGASLDLPKLNEVLDLAGRGEFDVLVVRELDRLARSLPKQQLIENILTKAGVQIEYVIGEYPATAEGTFLKNVRAAIAELERLKNAERTQRGKIQAVKAGSALVGKVAPYGYEIYRANGKTQLRLREDEARVVRLVFAWYGQGDEEGIKRSASEIARRLTAMGVPTYWDARPPHPNRKYVRHGSWSAMSVQHILRNAAYKGQWHYRKRQTVGKRKPLRPREEQIPVAIPAIVDEATWLAVQVRRGRPRRNVHPVRPSKYLLTGHIWCGMCDATIFGHISKGHISKGGGKRSKSQTYYACGDRLHRDRQPHACTAPYYPAEAVERVVWGWVETLLADRETLDRELRVLQTTWNERAASLRGQLEQVKEEIARHELQQKTILDLYVDERLSRTVWMESNAALQIALRRLTQEQAILKAELEEDNLTEQQIAGLHEFAGELLMRLRSGGDAHEVKRTVLHVLDLQVVLEIDAAGNRSARVNCLFGPANAAIAPVALTKTLPLPPGLREHKRVG